METEITIKQMTKIFRKQILTGCGAIALFLGVIILAINVKTIDSGQVGIKLRNGRSVASLNEGLHMQIPFVERIARFDARTQKKQVDASAASKDLQDVKATVALNFRINRERAGEIYRNLGVKYEDSIVDPKLQEAIKAVTARYTAEEIITKRTEVKQAIYDEVKSKLDSNLFTVEDINIVNIEFSPAFTQAIEQKQLAEQSAKKAQNDLERIRVENQQKIEQAKAEGDANYAKSKANADAQIETARGEAEARKLIAQTLSPEMIQKIYLEKWNGVLPQYMSSKDGSVILSLPTPTK